MLTKRAFMLTLAAVAAARPTHADVYPSRTIRLVIPFGPGTNSELIARLIAERLSVRFGQPVIVDNRPGAGGTLGAAAVAAADPDGYTLLVTPPGPLVTAGALYKNLKYDPGTSFTPVALLFRSPQLLAVNAAFPANTLQELIAYAVRRPRQITFASPGHGTQPHLLGERPDHSSPRGAWQRQGFGHRGRIPNSRAPSGPDDR
jgi:tripartite-type tricarboxylate transporter receptor subunit TctC